MSDNYLGERFTLSESQSKQPRIAQTHDAPHETYGKQVVELLQSFNSAFQTAGGAILSAERLRQMTAEDLLLLIASNHIRFVFEMPKD